MEECFNNIYKNKRVLLTGHSGFKGGWMSLFLKELGADVMGYSLPPNTEPSMFNVCNIKNDVKTVFNDIRNENMLCNTMELFKPDIIFHFAAQPLVRTSYEEPKLTYETNVMGTLNVYEAARKCSSVKAIVCITTDKCYENKEWEYGYRETDPMGGYDPYSSSKGCVELLTSSYRNSFFNKEGINIASVRAGNVIGGGDWAKDRLIPDFIRAVSENKNIIIRNPLATRPWQFVLEPLSGYLLVGEKLLEDKKEFNTAWNFGPNDSDIISVKDILDKSIYFMGKGNYQVDKSSQPHEANLLKLDISRAINRLKWRPVYDVDTAIEKTISWYKAYYNKDTNMKNFTLYQIKEYIYEARKKSIVWSE